jgi:SAM-dependent methyltransferase
MPRVDTHSFYHQAMNQHGITAGGVHWNSRYTQECRFDALRTLLPADLSTITLVDVGCGFGDLMLYLARNGDQPAHYLGVDTLEAMVKIARERTGAEIRQLDALADPLPEADYYLCSGAMNTLTKDETFCFIKRCFTASRQGFVFNLLRGADDSEVFNCRQPAEIATLGAQLGAEVRFREGYLHGDFSVALMHAQNA